MVKRRRVDITSVLQFVRLLHQQTSFFIVTATRRPPINPPVARHHPPMHNSPTQANHCDYAVDQAFAMHTTTTGERAARHLDSTSAPAWIILAPLEGAQWLVGTLRRQGELR